MEKKFIHFLLFLLFSFGLLAFFQIKNTTKIQSRPKYKSFPKSIRHHKYFDVSSSFQNKGDCEGFKNLKKVLLAINYNFPHYSSVPILKRYYERIFGKVIFCGAVESKEYGVIKINENKGYQGYECVATGIRLFPQFNGYIHSNDDVLLNWWNLLKLDITKIWIGNEIPYYKAHKFGEPITTKWHWWKTENTAHLCEVAFNYVDSKANTSEAMELNISSHLKQYFITTNNTKLCMSTWSDFFYIPSHYSRAYAYLSDIYSKNKVFLESAVPTILTFFLNKTNYHVLNGMYFNSIYGYVPKYLSGEAFYETYRFDLNFSHPFKLEGGMKAANRNFFQHVVMPYGKFIEEKC